MQIFEIIMLICFGLSWPISVYKSIRSGSTKGKSAVFIIAIIIGYISGIIGKIKSIITAENSKEHISLAPPREPVGKCPRCGGNVYKFVKDNKAVFYCENSPKSCFFRIYEDDFFFTSKGKTFTEDILKKLLLCGKAKVSGFKSERTGKKYDAIVSFTDRTDKNGNKKVGFAMEFENKKK